MKVAGLTNHDKQGYIPRMTPTAYHVLNAVKSIVDTDGVWPTVRVIGKAAGLASTNSVSYNIQKLLDNGFIEHHPCGRAGLFRLTPKAKLMDVKL